MEPRRAARTLTEFVDTNVLVYAHDTKAGSRHLAARELLARLWRDRAGAISVQVLQEFVVVTTRKIRSPIDLDLAERIVSSYAAWPVHEPGADDVVGAIDIVRRHGLSFWDAMIVRSAARLECDVLWTEHLNPGQTYDAVRAEDPFAARS